MMSPQPSVGASETPVSLPLSPSQIMSPNGGRGGIIGHSLDTVPIDA
jgi:hypothetical protein